MILPPCFTDKEAKAGERMGRAQGGMVCERKTQSTILVRSSCCLLRGRAQTFCPRGTSGRAGFSAQPVTSPKTDGETEVKTNTCFGITLVSRARLKRRNGGRDDRNDRPCRSFSPCWPRKAVLSVIQHAGRLKPQRQRQRQRQAIRRALPGLLPFQDAVLRLH